MRTTALLVGSALVVLAGTPHAVAVSPSADCTGATTAVEKLLCNDAQLATLDREMNRLFVTARDGAHLKPEERKELMASQRGWNEGRDECGKADDPRSCVLDEYVIRIHQLRQDYPEARTDDAASISRGPFAMTCTDLAGPISVTFVNADPSLACLGWGDEYLVLTQGPSGSGARYVAKDADGESVFWNKGNGGTLDLPGEPTRACDITKSETPN